MRNAAIDVKAANETRHRRVRDQPSSGNPTAGHRRRSHARAHPPHRLRKRAPQKRRALANHDRDRPRRQDPGRHGLGRHGTKVARVAQAFRDECDRRCFGAKDLTPEACREAGVGYASKDDLFRNADIISIHLPPKRSNPRPDRGEGPGPDEAHGLPRQHGARIVDQTALLAVNPSGGSPVPVSTSSKPSRCRSTTRCASSTMWC